MYENNTKSNNSNFKAMLSINQEQSISCKPQMGKVHETVSAQNPQLAGKDCFVQMFQLDSYS